MSNNQLEPKTAKYSVAEKIFVSVIGVLIAAILAMAVLHVIDYYGW